MIGGDITSLLPILLFLSNGSFLIPAIYVWMPWTFSTSDRRKIGWTFNSTFVHGLLCFCTMLASLFYHMCDEGDCFLLPWSTMYVSDYVVSVMVPFNMLTYGAPVWMRDAFILLGLFGLSYLASAYQITQDLNAFYLFGFVASGAILWARFLVRVRRPDARWWMWPLRQKGKVWIFFPTEGNYWFAVPCVLVWIGALVCFLFFNNDPEIYEYIHPTWHFLAAMGQLLGFMYFDSM